MSHYTAEINGSTEFPPLPLPSPSTNYMSLWRNDLSWRESTFTFTS